MSETNIGMVFDAVENYKQEMHNAGYEWVLRGTVPHWMPKEEELPPDCVGTGMSDATVLRCPEDNEPVIERGNPSIPCPFGPQMCTHICPRCGMHYEEVDD